MAAELLTIAIQIVQHERSGWVRLAVVVQVLDALAQSLVVVHEVGGKRFQRTSARAASLGLATLTRNQPPFQRGSYATRWETRRGTALVKSADALVAQLQGDRLANQPKFSLSSVESGARTTFGGTTTSYRCCR